MSRNAPDLVPFDALISLADQHLRGLRDVYRAPDIPPKKLLRARAMHGPYVQASDPIAVLCDSTVFGSADDGFIATPARLCWKNQLEHPRTLRWDELAQLTLDVRGSNIEIGRGHLEPPMGERAADRIRDFLEACGKRTRRLAAPYRDRAEGHEPATFAELIVAAARRALGELDWVHYAPAIPPRMLAAVRVVHARNLRAEDTVHVLYDDTVLGSGSDGFVLTERGICWRNFWGTAEARRWSDLDPERIASDGDLLLIDGGSADDDRGRIDLRMRAGMAQLVARVLREIALAARAP